jgi:hypothetical protein
MYEKSHLSVDLGPARVGGLRHRADDGDNYDNYTGSDNDRSSPRGGSHQDSTSRPS